MNRVFLLLGSNLGDREQILREASAELIERLLPDYLEVGELQDAVRSSAIYETEPWGFSCENNFLNMALMLLTEYPPYQTLKICKEIEQKLGREAHEPKLNEQGERIYESRPIDIDILLFYNESNTVVMQEKELTIPHPKLHERVFALEPLAEIAGDLEHPLLKKRIKDLVKFLK